MTTLKNLKNLFLSFRPQQWIKNLFVFAALIFSQEFLNIKALQESIAAFLIFIIASSAVYLFNDLIDLPLDKKHPFKKNRPLAAGKLKVWEVATVSLALGLSALVLSSFLNFEFFLIVLIYIFLNILYSLILKKIILVDILIVTIGFVLRAMAGAEAIKVSISPWLIVCTFFVALFLVTGKRLAEINNHNEDFYKKSFLDKILVFSLATTILSYVLYTIDAQTIMKFKTTNLLYTTIFVLFGLLRYFYLIETKNEGAKPSETLLTDKPIILTTLLWALSVIFLIYQRF